MSNATKVAKQIENEAAACQARVMRVIADQVGAEIAVSGVLVHVYGVDLGKRWAKVWKRFENASDRSVVAFVDRATGEVRRADSWKKPGRILMSAV